MQHVLQLEFSTGLQFIFQEFSTQCSAIAAEVDNWHVTQKVVIQPANELSFALDPCSDSLLLGVSAVELDAPPGLTSGWLFDNFSTSLPFFAPPLSTISFFNSCPAFFCVLSNSITTWASCSASVFFQNVLSQIHSFCTSATVQLILLLDCWCLLRASCCCIPRTANTQIQEMQIPSICHLPDVSHSVSSVHLLASTAEIHRCGQACRQKLLTSTSCSIWLHPLNDFGPNKCLQMAPLLQCSPCPG